MVTGGILSDPGRPWASPTIALSASFISTKRARKIQVVSFFREMFMSKIYSEIISVS